MVIEKHEFKNRQESVLTALSGSLGHFWFGREVHNWQFFNRFLYFKCSAFHSELSGRSRTSSTNKFWNWVSTEVKQSFFGIFGLWGFWYQSCLCFKPNFLYKCLAFDWNFNEKSEPSTFCDIWFWNWRWMKTHKFFLHLSDFQACNGGGAQNHRISIRVLFWKYWDSIWNLNEKIETFVSGEMLVAILGKFNKIIPSMWGSRNDKFKDKKLRSEIVFFDWGKNRTGTKTYNQKLKKNHLFTSKVKFNNRFMNF